ncbi:MAG: D-glycero-beta-D-manno-heptose 1-phosphate adenylyltransferase [Desulfobacteraceae bacterium 4572_130]|nr:MAG: D-glycero-beta-D-manno-heptose 1-phosphate adenylyltransferase [Desulfobacteraceae bacterium 4572_130]
MNQKKIIPRFEIREIITKLKAEKKTIVFTNGCFDILHSGHVKYLRKAAQYGNILVLGLNSDKSVKNIKGDKRPINKENYRACVVEALFCIDYIVLFDEPDPMSLIKEIEPDVLVKGADWSIKNIIGSDFVKKKGGIVKTINLEPDISTTIIINKIVEKYGK